MHSLKLLFLALTSTLISTALSASSAKPTINPPATDLSWHLTRLLKGFSNEITFWTNDKINWHCKKIFAENGYNASDIQMFHVHFEDCYLPWTMCMHPNSSYHAGTLALTIGLIPVTMRQYIRHVVALPSASATTPKPNTWMQDDSVVIRGNASLHDVLATSATGLGKWGMQNGNGYYDTQSWLSASTSSPAVLNPTAQLNEAENFAQMVVVALAELQNPGCWEGVIPELDKVRCMMERIQEDLARHFEVREEGMQCVRRPLEDSVVGRAGELPGVE